MNSNCITKPVSPLPVAANPAAEHNAKPCNATECNSQIPTEPAAYLLGKSHSTLERLSRLPIYRPNMDVPKKMIHPVRGSNELKVVGPLPGLKGGIAGHRIEVGPGRFYDSDDRQIYTSQFGMNLWNLNESTLATPSTSAAPYFRDYGNPAIPQQAHFSWFGSEEPDLTNVENFAALNPHWGVTVSTDSPDQIRQSLPDTSPVQVQYWREGLSEDTPHALVQYMENNRDENPWATADAYKFSTLRAWGGVHFDMDVKHKKRLPDYIPAERRTELATYSPHGLVENSVIGAIPGAQALRGIEDDNVLSLEAMQHQGKLPDPADFVNRMSIAPLDARTYRQSHSFTRLERDGYFTVPESNGEWGDRPVWIPKEKDSQT